MRYYRRLRCCTVLLLTLLLACGFRKDELGSWKEKQLLKPEVLAERIRKGDTVNLLILNTGPVEDIAGAVHSGAMEETGNPEKLRSYLAAVSRDKEVVVYCGCCPLSVCPNLRPAYDILKELKFSNVKVLRLPNELQEDWIGKGYPMP